MLYSSSKKLVGIMLFSSTEKLP